MPWTIALLAAVLQAQPTIRIEAVPGKGHQATATPFPSTALDAVTERIMRSARETCGRQEARFGRFKYLTPIIDGRSMITDYRQSFSCIDPATDPYARAPDGWQPSDRDKADAKAFAERFMTAIDRGNGAAGVAMMEPIVEIDEAEWLSLTAPMREARTGTGSWTIAEVGWGNNLEGASHPGSYVMMSVDARYPGIAAFCGILLIYRVGPGSYQVTAQDLKLVTQAQVDRGEIDRAGVVRICAE